MLDKLAYMLGGRAAEEMVFHDPTTGAGNDIEKATGLARAMVTQYGMTERLGAIKLGDTNSEPFLGRDMGHPRNYSEETAAAVDEETKKLLGHAHQEAFDILEENRDVLDALVLALLDKETLDKAQIAEIFEPLRRRPVRPAWTGSPERVPSTIPPVEIPQEIRDRVDGRRRPPRRSRPGPVRSSPRPGAGGDVHGGPEAGAPTPPTAAVARRHDDRPDHRRRSARPRTSRTSTTTGPRPRCASCCSRSARTPTARACWTPRPGSPGRTPS